MLQIYVRVCVRGFIYIYICVCGAGIRGRGHVTINQVSTDTAVHPHDIALAFMLLGKQIL